MPCNKKKPAVIGTKANQAARETWRESNHDLPPEPVTPTERSSPDPPLPKVSYNTIRNELLDRTSRRGTIEASLIPLPDDQENDSPRTIRFYPKQNFEDDWRKMGYYTEHPVSRLLCDLLLLQMKYSDFEITQNNNPAAVNEAQLKKMMEKHHRLGKVVEKYRLFINKPSGKRTMLLQYPNREIGQEYRASTGQKPLEIRIKPKCGLVEVDIPIHLHYNYDKVKGIEYGEAMRKSRLMQQGGSYSLGGGLGIGPKPTSKDDHRAPLPEGPSQEKLLENIDDANNKGHVMNKITLGGQIFPPKDGDPIYMIATFQGSEQIKSAKHIYVLISSKMSVLGRN